MWLAWVFLQQSLAKCAALKRLFVNDNELDFNGIPASVGRLESLEVFLAADNKIEMVPEGLLRYAWLWRIFYVVLWPERSASRCRCGKLKKLVLRNNLLVTLPDAIHYLSDLQVSCGNFTVIQLLAPVFSVSKSNVSSKCTEQSRFLQELDLSGNPDLIVPPKPADLQKGAGLAFYNIDFSLGHQMRLAGSMTHQDTPSPGTRFCPVLRNRITKKNIFVIVVPVRDPVARKIRLRTGRVKGDEEDENAGQVIKGMKDLAKARKGSREDLLEREPVK